MRTRSEAAQSRQPGLTEDPKVAMVNRTGAPMTVTVDWGRNLYAPIKFNTFEVDGPSITFVVPPDGDVAAQFDQVWAACEMLAKRQFNAKLNSYLEQAQAAAEAVEAGKR